MKKFLVALLVCSLMVGCRPISEMPGEEPVARDSPEASMRLTVKELVASLVKDRQSAERLYLGKRLRVSGVVTELRRATDGRLSFELESAVVFFVDKRHESEFNGLGVGSWCEFDGILADVGVNPFQREYVADTFNTLHFLQVRGAH